MATALFNLPLLNVFARLEMIDQTLMAIAAGMAVAVVLMLFAYIKSTWPRAMARRRGRFGGAGWLLLGFVALIALSNFINLLTGNRDDGQDVWLRYVMAFHPVLLFFVFKNLTTDPRGHLPLLRCFDVLTAGLALSVLLALWGFYEAEGYGLRRFGILGDQVAWLLSALLLANLARGKWVLCGISALALLATGSRGAMAVAIAALLLHTFVARERDVRSTINKFGTIGAALVAILLSEGLTSVVMERFSATDLTSNDRISTTLFTLGVFQEFPIVGGGYNAHTYFFHAYGHRSSPYEIVYATPVSTFAQVLADGGVVGGVLFAAFVVSIFITAMKVMRWPEVKAVPKGSSDEFRAMCSGMAAWAMAFLVLNQSATYLLPTSMLGELTFIILGCIAGCRNWQAGVTMARHSPGDSARPFQARNPAGVRGGHWPYPGAPDGLGPAGSYPRPRPVRAAQ